MIFVSVGTHEAPFDRMLQAVFELDLDEDLVVQYGPSTLRTTRASTQVDYLPFDAVVANIRRARAVVMHAGVGSVMISLANGKRPIVMARRREFDEHVDDHQVELARRMESNGLATAVAGASELERALEDAGHAPAGMRGVPWLGEDLGRYLAEQLGTPRPAALTSV
jgi:UDP-N-acetylglucosamine transferase subunit ALG13